MAKFYYAVLVLGGAFIAIGFVILILVVKFLHNNWVKHIITALIFLIGGISIAVIMIVFIPSPQSQREYVSKMLKLNAEKVELLTIYNRNKIENSVVEINEKPLLEEWIFILQSCKDFNPNHPRYEDKYMVILDDDDGNRYLYEIAIDAKVPETADLKLLKKSEFESGFSNLGYYQCEGLFEFISEIARGME